MNRPSKMEALFEEKCYLERKWIIWKNVIWEE